MRSGFVAWQQRAQNSICFIAQEVWAGSKVPLLAVESISCIEVGVDCFEALYCCHLQLKSYCAAAFLLGAQPPPAHTLELWAAAAGHTSATQVEFAVVQWLECLPLILADSETIDLSLLTLDLLEVPYPIFGIVISSQKNSEA